MKPLPLRADNHDQLDRAASRLLSGQPLAVLDRGASGVRRALMLRGWSDEVTLLSDGDPSLEPTRRVAFERRALRSIRDPSPVCAGRARPWRR